MRRNARTGVIALSAVLIVLGGCQSTGGGYGTTRDGAPQQVRFNWVSQGAVTGTMTATWDDGRQFSGSYFQITSDTRIESLQPLWQGWNPAWRRWRHWTLEPRVEFVKHYTGRVMANLAASNGERMRCRFRLVRPASGMAGGGEGDCQGPDGVTIEATFPSS